MYGIYNRQTDELDCDPEPMVFETMEEARTFLLEAYDDKYAYYISEVA